MELWVFVQNDKAYSGSPSWVTVEWFVTLMFVPLSAYAWWMVSWDSFFIFVSVNIALWLVGGAYCGRCRYSGMRKG